MKKEQEELMAKSTKEIEELNKEHDQLLVEKEQLWDNIVQLENVISQVYERVPEVATDEDTEAKVQRLGMIIAQLEHNNNILNALVHLETLPRKIPKRKSAIEDVVTHLEEMKQEVKKVIDATMQFWGSVVQNEQLAQLTNELQEVEGQLPTLKMKLREMPQIF